jgi:hypothetical protein
MRFIKDSLSAVKNAAAAIATFTMVISPVAQGAEAKTVATAKAKVRVKTVDYNYNVDKKSTQDFLKYSGLNKKHLTVGEFHAKMRPFYPKTLREEMDQWVQMNRNEFMPEVEATTFKDSDGKERVRLLITKDGQTTTATYNPENNAKFVKVNNVYLTKDDIKYHEQVIRKIIWGDKGIQAAIAKAPVTSRLKKSVVLGYEEFSRLKPRQRAEYFVRLRYVMEDAQQVFTKLYGSQAANKMNRDFFVQWLLLGDEAEAKGTKAKRGAMPGDACIVSGYLAAYGNDYSCGGTGPGRAKLIEEMNKFGGGQCTNGTISCNPLVYGYQANGSAICVKNGPKQEIQVSTSQSCPKQSPLRKGTPDEAKDKKAIIESYLKANGATDAEKNINLLFDKDGKISKAQYDLIKEHLDKLNKYIDEAVSACATVPLSDIKKVRDEQESACRALATRKIEILSYPETPLLPIITPPGEKDCSLEKANSVLVDGKCVCTGIDGDGTITEDGKERPACVSPYAPGDKSECNKDETRDEKTGECIVAGACIWCKWLAGGAVLAAVAGGIYWITKDDKDNKTTTNPIPDPCPPAPYICLPPGASPPLASLTPPPIQPAPPVTNQPPLSPVPPPKVTPFVEPTNGTSTSTSGGIK